MSVGQVWKTTFQVGKETTRGTAVAASRRMYFAPDGMINDEGEARFYDFSTATRAQTRAATPGVVRAIGSVSQQLSYSESVELALAGIRGAVVPTQPDSVGNPTVYLWTFTEGDTLDPWTLEWDDGARAWRGLGVSIDELTYAFNVREGWTVQARLLGLDFAQNALTGALASRDPNFIEGWETKVYIDAFGGTPGTTAVDCYLVSANITYRNNLALFYAAKNSRAACDLVPGVVSVEGTLTVRASEAAALTAFNDLRAATKKMIRLETGNNTTLTGIYKGFVTLDLPGAYMSRGIGDVDGVRTYELRYRGIYDSTAGYMFRKRLQNQRSAAYTAA